MKVEKKKERYSSHVEKKVHPFELYAFMYQDII